MKSTHADLVEMAAKWLRSHKFSVVITEMTSQAAECPDAIGWKNGSSTLIECKASRSDFLADKKKHFRRRPHKAMGIFRYYLAPRDMLSPDEIPEPWGLLIPHGRTLAIAKTAQGSDTNRGEEIDVLVSALRRIHRGVDGRPRGVYCRLYQFDRPSGNVRATLGVEAAIEPVAT